MAVPKEGKDEIRRVMKKDEEKSFEDLGLGRGVDATNPTPWLNKRALQVRNVIYKDIIGTEEGNLYQGFVNEVESTQHFQTNLSASVPVNQLVNLGIDSELSRTYSVSQKSVGRKINTRTISFRASFDGIYEQSEMEEGGPSEQHQKGKETKTFEQRLNDWIEQQKEEEVKIKEIKAIKEKSKAKQGGIKLEEPNGEDKKGEQKDEKEKSKAKQGGIKLEEPNGEDKKGEQKDEKELYKLCYKFVSTFSVTHYVQALELGASHYRVMSLEEYTTKFSSKAKLGVGQMADVAIGNEKSLHSKKYKSQTTKVGRMKTIADDDDDYHSKRNKESGGSKANDGQNSGNDSKSPEEEIQRGTIGEAVVGVKLQPISSLVSDIALRLELQKALQQYIRNKQKVKFGPFYIACNWDQLYLTFNKSKDFQVEATYNINEASEFYVVRCDEGDNHFNIVCETSVSFKRPMDEEKFVARVGEVEHKPAIPMYLCASVNWRGKSKRNQPLKMRLDGKSTNSRLAIHCRKSRLFHPADLTEWVNEKEIFFINCQERSVMTPTNSYLCVYESGETGCKPKIKSHDDKRRFMLFRLIKPKEQAEQSGPASAPVENNLTLGPFLIKNTHFRDHLFFTVSDKNDIEVTKEPNHASQFYIKRVSEYSGYFEIISSDRQELHSSDRQELHSSDRQELHSSDRQELHLSAMVDWRGYRSLPLQLRSDANARSYLAIYDKISQPKDMKLEDPSKCESEEFYISCYVKPAFSKEASYLIINQKTDWRGRNVEVYSTGCVPSIKHNMKDGEPMLFKLVAPPNAEPPPPNAEPPPPNAEHIPQNRSPQACEQGDDDNGSFHIETTDELT